MLEFKKLSVFQNQKSEPKVPVSDLVAGNF